MSKSPDAFRSIGEVSRLVGVAPHVLRYWESQFSQLSPVKRSDGRRYYRPDDVRLVAGLCQVMREEGMSIRGAKRLIAADRGAGLRQIGALRLGEARGDAPADLPGGPAVRLALPKPSLIPAMMPDTISGAETVAESAAATPALAFEFAEAPAAISPPAPPAMASAAPLPPADQGAPDHGAWLRYLTDIAARLRRAQPSALPPQLARALRQAAAGAR